MKQFEQWRSQKQDGQRIPQHLWQADASLYLSCPVNKIARSLRMDSGDLRDHIQLTGGKNRCSKPHEVPQFMPLTVTPFGGLADCRIKVKDGRKTRVTIRLKGTGVELLVELPWEAWSRGA